MERRDRLAGVLLGTALGDALGLATEGLSPAAIARRFGRVDRFYLLGRTGYVSDDTEQAALVAQSLARHPADVAAFVRAFRRALLGWFLRLPWGLGLATLRACVRLALGFARSGVYSAGNGAAMRAAVLGVFFCDDADARARFGTALAEVTHVDPRAVDGARFVAEVAAMCTRAEAAPARCLAAARDVVREPALRAAIDRALALADAGVATDVAARALGTTGFVVHCVPFAAYCFARYGREPLTAITEVVCAGGDTDSTGAIVGAWAGALRGPDALPAALLARIHKGPFGVAHLRALADDLAGAPAPPHRARYSWLGAMARNLALYPVVLAHGFRRLLP